LSGCASCGEPAACSSSADSEPGRSLGWGSAYGFVDAAGKSLVRGKISPGLTRTNGEIEVADSLSETDVLLAAALTAYLLIRKADDNASATAGSVAATSGGTG
jgi:hypothetical protein